MTKKTKSSETTREAFVFNFLSYYQITGNKILRENAIFLEWFIGFSEGDGSFGLTKCLTEKKSNK